LTPGFGPHDDVADALAAGVVPLDDDAADVDDAADDVLAAGVVLLEL
jgi:hypothetical protein